MNCNDKIPTRRINQLIQKIITYIEYDVENIKVGDIKSKKDIVVTINRLTGLAIQLQKYIDKNEDLPTKILSEKDRRIIDNFIARHK